MTGEEVMDIFHGTGRNGKTKFYKTIFKTARSNFSTTWQCEMVWPIMRGCWDSG